MDPSSLLTRMRIRAMGIVITSPYSRRWDGERGGGGGRGEEEREWAFYTPGFLEDN